MSEAFTTLDVGVLAAYLIGVTVWGAWLGRGQKGGSDYFLGRRELPWFAVMLSVVATETSTLTFLSIPGVSYLGTLTFLQLTFGYFLGRVAVSLVFLPGYASGDITTAYGMLETRFGTGARRFTSAVFMVTRLLADSVRLFATAIPLAIITGWPYPVSIAAIALLTVVYTYLGGIRAVVWVDALQMGLYLLGGVVALVAIGSAVEGGWGTVLADAAAAGKLQVLDFSFTLSTPYTFWAGVIGGGFLTMASHGTDQLIVQRLLTCRDLRASQKALVGSGIAVLVQFALFLVVGLGLWVYYRTPTGPRVFDRPDEIFARFIVEGLPPGLTGLLMAGVFAAAMSSLSSSINSLASASAYDFWAPLRGITDDGLLLRAGRAFTLIWSALLVGGAVLFIPLSRGTSAVEVALAVASLVYGGLLGAFLLGVRGVRASSAQVALAMSAGIGVVTAIWVVWTAQVAWPWFVPIGSAVTFTTGRILARTRGAQP
ncbi:MAG: sodium:solute symporter [Gemmatimonadota bacterium]|nr:sodium:solute symporter [Gemmatimonadota bacterium]